MSENNPLIADVWKEAVEYLADGISVIPVRDKEETIDGTVYKKKEPFLGWGWKKYQNQHISKEQLWYELEKLNTNAIATLCGKISGGLEVIDVDVKWKPGIQKTLFNAIKELYPELMEKLRINKTPSRGFHILYRILDHEVPKGAKLASRLATEEEIAVEKSKYRCFIETRAEGQYVVAPPSLGYVTVLKNLLPKITWEERNNLINICLSFTEIIKQDKPKATSSDSDYYSLNPFEHYNQSDRGANVLMDNGWTFYRENSEHIYFTRPGSKTGGIHATFMKRSKLFRIFTTNSELDAETNYTPSTVRAVLMYGGDKKKLRAALINEGFGKIRQDVEKTIVKNKVLQGAPLPPNVSAEAKEQYATLVIKHSEANPYGIFWAQKDNGSFEISREQLYEVSNKMGFRLRRGELYRVMDKFVDKVESAYFFDTLKNYVTEEDGGTHLKICNCLEAFWQKSGDFTIERLRNIEEEELLLDTATECYKFFTNGYLRITATESELNGYESLERLVFKSRVQQRAFVRGEIGGMYNEFLHLGCRYGEKTAYINKIIGFLAHEYKDETTPFIIVLTEECADPKEGGGSGKNVFCTIFENTTTIHDVPGSQVKFDEKFLQSWDGEKIMAVSDVPKKFDFGFLKNLSSGKGKLKKLYKDEASVDVKDMPKFIIQTNFGIDNIDGGMSRRIRQVEFTDFFTQRGGVDVHFGCYFPNGWQEEDWIGYDNLIVEAVQEWLRGGRKIDKIELSLTGFQKQFDQDHGIATRSFIEKNWVQWSTEYFVKASDFKNQYDEFCSENEIKDNFRKSPQNLNNALNAWCKEKGYEFDKEKQKCESDGKNYKGKSFIPKKPPF